MKKIYFTTALIIASMATGFATDYFVDPLNGSDSNDGLSWGNALKTLSSVDAIIASDAANADNIFIKGGTITSSSQWSPKSQNYYFSCAGTETLASQRELEDKDGNGIIESWEFKTPSVLNTNITSGYALSFGSSTSVVSTLVDGLTVTLTGTTATATSKMAAVYWFASTNASVLNTGIFQNGVISNCNLNFGSSGANNTSTNYGCLVNVANNGLMKNCLIEKNKITIFSGNTIIMPVASLTLSTISNVTPKITNVVVRNNYGSITMSGATSTNRLTGLVFGVGIGNATYNMGEGIVSNCLVYNNEIVYNGPTGYTQATTASLAGVCYSTYGKATYRNCLFANNKLTNLASAMYFVRNANNNYVANNCVFWNNQNTVSEISTGVSMATSGNLYVGSSVTNNVMDVATAGEWGTVMTYANNLTDLAQTNTGSNAPYFSIPTTFTGSKGVNDENDPLEIYKAKWTLSESSSYLIGKGTSYSEISTDLAGNSFATLPAAGVYEYVAGTITSENKPESPNAMCVKVENRTLLSLTNDVMRVYTISGVLINSFHGKGETINLNKPGVYVIKTESQFNTQTQKLILR